MADAIEIRSLRTIAFYERYGFLPLQGVREGALHGGPTPMFLAIATVAESLAG